MSVVYETGGKGAGWVDDRLGNSSFIRRSLNKVFPDHWSFMLGEIALYSFIVILLTGRVPDPVVQAVDDRGRLRRLVRAAQGREDE